MSSQHERPAQRPGGESGSVELWMVLAIIQPFRLDTVTLALQAIPGFGGMTVSPCRGFGHEKLTSDPDEQETTSARADPPRRRRSDAALDDFTEKVKLEIAIAGRERADAVIEAIARTAHTGNLGDGKVFAWPLARAVRVRTFDVGTSAL